MASRKPKAPLRGFVKGKDPITLAPSSTEQGRFEILLEAMRDENRITREVVLGFQETFKRQLSELRRDLTARLDVLESAVRSLRDDVHGLQQAVERMRVQLAGKVEIEDLRKLEARVAALEARFTS